MAGHHLSSPELVGITAVPCLCSAGQLPGLGPLPRRADEADAVLLPGPQGQPQGVVGASGVAQPRRSKGNTGGGWQRRVEDGSGVSLPLQLGRKAPANSAVALSVLCVVELCGGPSLEPLWGDLHPRC